MNAYFSIQHTLGHMKSLKYVNRTLLNPLLHPNHIDPPPQIITIFVSDLVTNIMSNDCICSI